MYYVYILKLSDKSYYVGYSSDLKNRIKTHNEGSVSSTKNLRPVKLIYYSAFLTQKKAIDFEK
ncbi:GIY-YIG nuclease family protein [Candidatus Roizmanbacteria bacterium]|nr:GIY-YIG nuclease family protein [Candidatus Roizmanbacteria bacterium]